MMRSVNLLTVAIVILVLRNAFLEQVDLNYFPNPKTGAFLESLQ
jgi:hypothetical protein